MLSAADAISGVAKMSFSNDGISWSPWETYAISKTCTLPAGDGLKTVYFRVKDNAGNIADTVSDT